MCVIDWLSYITAASSFTYSCISWFSHNSTPHNNLPKQLGAFLDRLSPLVEDEWRMSHGLLSILGKKVCRAGIQTHNPWIDSPRRYRLSYRGSARVCVLGSLSVPIWSTLYFSTYLFFKDVNFVVKEHLIVLIVYMFLMSFINLLIFILFFLNSISLFHHMNGWHFVISPSYESCKTPNITLSSIELKQEHILSWETIRVQSVTELGFL